VNADPLDGVHPVLALVVIAIAIFVHEVPVLDWDLTIVDNLIGDDS